MKIAVGCLIVLAALTAPALAARTVSQAGYDLIKGFEGLSLVAYQWVSIYAFLFSSIIKTNNF